MKKPSLRELHHGWLFCQARFKSSGNADVISKFVRVQGCPKEILYA